MNTKLTLRLDDSIIKKIKKLTSKHRISVSKLTERLYSDLISVENLINSDITPIVKKYRGILQDSDYDDIRLQYLNEKYK